MTATRTTGARPHRRGTAVVRLLLPVLALGLTLGGCQAAPPTSTDPTSQGSTVTTSEFSTLDAAGVATIRESKAARLDMSSGRLEKSAVNVTDDSYGPEINTRDAGKISLSITAPNGEVSGETDRIRFNTTGSRPDFSEVTYFLTADSAADYFSLVRDGVRRYGIDSGSAERWISSAEAAPDAKSDFSLTSGNATGLEITYDLRYDGGAGTRVIIVHVLPAG
ncbi:hypothetical protein ASF72_15140 [Arthrobacter sp. Leaf141]|jgi:hypothetical protein|uniref:hypothetical protein n=1 Tax=Micrococcaceae TaxID=1268 RepID=UPI000700AE27|nr:MULTISPECIES: hypothetical protein [Micrococcaceae]KQR00210.1 hypothetical protein ASF72_15140 [Arthrobacter sp. Leaf141]